MSYQCQMIINQTLFITLFIFQELIFDGTQEKGLSSARGFSAENVLPDLMNYRDIDGHIQEKKGSNVMSAIRNS